MNIEIVLPDIMLFIAVFIAGVSLTICAQIGFKKLRSWMENIGGEKVVSIGTRGN